MPAGRTRHTIIVMHALRGKEVEHTSPFVRADVSILELVLEEGLPLMAPAAAASAPAPRRGCRPL